MFKSYILQIKEEWATYNQQIRFRLLSGKMVFSIKSIQEIWYQLLSQFSHFLSLSDQKLDLFNQGSLKAMSKAKFHFYIYLGTIQVLNFQTVQCAPLVQMHILFFFFFWKYKFKGFCISHSTQIFFFFLWYSQKCFGFILSSSFFFSSQLTMTKIQWVFVSITLKLKEYLKW